MEVFVAVRNDGWFEIPSHLRKTLEGLMDTIKKGNGLIKSGGFKIYRLNILEGDLMYDSEREKGKTDE